MSEQKKYIGKKRPKIFTIEKNYPKTTPKYSTRKKNNHIQIESSIPSQEIPTENPKNNYLNLEENNDKISAETHKHSLIGISKLVFDYLKTIVYTTGNEVTDHIKNVLKSKKNDQLNQKNIQRRVYDAINVMCAVGLIKKNKQKIQFLKKNFFENRNNNLNDEINISENNQEENKEKKDNDEKIKEKLNELEENRKILVKKYFTLKFYDKFNELNEKFPQRKLQNKLEFPFDLIKYDNSSPIKITSKEDSSRYLLLSNSNFVHLAPYDIIKKLITPDILLKYKENPNNNVDNKSNSKKSTNDNSMMEEYNYNLNNNYAINNINEEQEEKKFEETPQKTKTNSNSYSYFKYIIPKEKDPKNKKEEKEDDAIFEYLKDKKCFLDELENNNDPQEEMINPQNNDINKNKEEPENNFEKENENIMFTEKRSRKNSNISYGSNFYDDNLSKRNKGDLMSEIEMFM